jgi:cobalt/nickel transport system ATP-binding protein
MFQVDQVTFRYGSVVALNKVSLDIQEGRRSALLGANGSGKSTLLRMLDGLCFPDSGAISFRGDKIDPLTLEDDKFAQAFRRRVGLVFQNPDVQLFNPTVFDEVAFGPLQMRWSKNDIRDRVESTLETLEITHLKDRPPHRLSGGEKKRVAIWFSTPKYCYWTNPPLRSIPAARARLSIC